MSRNPDNTISNKARGGIPGPFLTLAVAVSFIVGSLSYMNGSAPEWIALKSSISIFTIGIMGWLVSAFISPRSEQIRQEAEDRVQDAVLPEATPAEAETAVTSDESSSGG